MGKTSLIPGGHYWARSSKYFGGNLTVVQVSDVFGADPDYWTLAIIGTDQHAMPYDFEIIGPATPADTSQLRQAAE